MVDIVFVLYITLWLCEIITSSYNIYTYGFDYILYYILHLQLNDTFTGKFLV